MSVSTRETVKTQVCLIVEFVRACMLAQISSIGCACTYYTHNMWNWICHPKVLCNFSIDWRLIMKLLEKAKLCKLYLFRGINDYRTRTNVNFFFAHQYHWLFCRASTAYEKYCSVNCWASLCWHKPLLNACTELIKHFLAQSHTCMSY